VSVKVSKVSNLMVMMDLVEVEEVPLMGDTVDQVLETEPPTVPAAPNVVPTVGMSEGIVMATAVATAVTCPKSSQRIHGEGTRGIGKNSLNTLNRSTGIRMEKVYVGLEVVNLGRNPLFYPLEKGARGGKEQRKLF